MKNVDETKECETGACDTFGLSRCEGGEKTVAARGVKSEKGVVLVVVLVLSAVVLAVMTALIYMITSGTQISGFHKRYKTSLEAARGGSEFFYQVIDLRGNPTNLTGLPYTIPPAASPPCTGTDAISGAIYTGLAAKISLPSLSWSNCNSSLTIDPKDPATYDISIVLGGGPPPYPGGPTPPQYNFYAKIVSTLPGNSGSLASGSLYTGSVITGLGGGGGGGGAIPVVSKPYMYAIEVYAENSSNTAERAKFSILYQY